MAVKIMNHEIVCEHINRLKEMKEGNLVFTREDWETCTPAAKAVISILILAVITLIDDMEKVCAQSSAVRELLGMFQWKLFCSSTEKTEKVVKKTEGEKAADESEQKETQPDVSASPEQKKTWPRRIAGFAGKFLGRLKEKIEYRNKEDTKPISEDDPEYPRDSLGNLMVRAGTEVTVTLRYIPAQIIKVKSIAQKFISREMINGKHEHATIRGRFKGMFRGSTYSPEPETLAAFAWLKYGLHMPVNRIVTDFRRHGVNFSRGTISSWLNRSCMYLDKLMPYYFEQLFTGIIIQADETVITTQKRKDSKEGSQNGKNYAWIFTNPVYTLKRVVIYDSGDLTRKISNAEAHLKGFKGILLTDAYQAYMKLTAVIHAFCLIHSRRKFVECIPANAGVTDPRIEEILNIFKNIFKYEESFKGMNTDGRKEKRAIYIRPLINELKEKCEAIRTDKSVSKKGKLFKAANYFLNNWEQFNVFFLHGNISLHNQESELGIRSMKLGLKNFMTFGSPKGASTACAYYSVFQTAMRNGLDPEKYLSYIFTQCTQNPDKLDDRDFMVNLLPWNPEVMRLCADAEHHTDYNDPEWMECFQRRLCEEETANTAFKAEIEEALKEQQAKIERQQDTAKKESSRKRKETNEAKKQKKLEKQKLLDTFNYNKSALTPNPIPESSQQKNYSFPKMSVQLE